MTVHSFRNRLGVTTPCFVRSIVSHHGRLFAWSVWFGASIAHDFRAQFSGLDMLHSQHVVTHAVYDISSDPDEMQELWSDGAWRRTSLARLLWEQVRKHVVSLPEPTLHTFVDVAYTTYYPPQALLRARKARALRAQRKEEDKDGDGGGADEKDGEGDEEEGRKKEDGEGGDEDGEEGRQDGSAVEVFPPTEGMLSSQGGKDCDDDADSWCSGPAPAVDLNAMGRGGCTPNRDDATTSQIDTPHPHQQYQMTRRQARQIAGRPR